jgi:hypothetical protein
MRELMLSFYVLVWPLIVAGVLFFIVRGFVREWRKARSKGKSLI